MKIREFLEGLFIVALVVFTCVMTVTTQERRKEVSAVSGPSDRIETAIYITVAPTTDLEEDTEPYVGSEYEAAVFETKRSEYPAAAHIWEVLKANSYNDYVIAGILGNFMCECAGQNLNLQVTVDNGKYYGIAQWSHRFYPEVIGKNLDGQLNFLLSTIPSEFNTFGKLYKSGFKYQDFLNLTNEKDAALAFAKVYERCGSGSYNARQRCATKAYEYFVGK